MSTREEIDAAVAILAEYYDKRKDPAYHDKWWDDVPGARQVLSDAYIEQHARDQQPPTREMFERLGAMRAEYRAMLLHPGPICWPDSHLHPGVVMGDGIVALDTIAKRRVPASYRNQGRRCSNCAFSEWAGVAGSHTHGLLCAKLTGHDPEFSHVSREEYKERVVALDGACDLHQFSTEV